MRLVLGCVVLAGCGRFGFDAPQLEGRDGATDGRDAAVDTPVGMACSTDSECGRCARCNATCQIEPINKLVLGHRSTCYLGANGDRWCAGDNSGGRLGLGDTIDRSTPERALDGGGWVNLYLSYYTPSIGVRPSQFFQWGPPATSSPQLLGSSRPLRDILGSTDVNCYWEQDGTASCDPSATVWHSFATNTHHRCGAKPDGTLWCVGENRNNALGLPAVPVGTTTTTLAQVGTDTDWAEVGVIGNNASAATCARKTNGRVWCWGHPDFTGTNGINVGVTPTEVSTTSFAWMRSDWERTCAGTAAGMVSCWGRDSYGGFVLPAAANVPAPMPIAETYTKFEMGGHHACGLTAAGRWRCFGWNTYGQLGVGDLVNDGVIRDLCP